MRGRRARRAALDAQKSAPERVCSRNHFRPSALQHRKKRGTQAMREGGGYITCAVATANGFAQPYRVKIGVHQIGVHQDKPAPSSHRRALIVEDETMIALSLEADMRALGFDICDLATNGQQASRLAMSNQPDVVLMDVNLEGGREGIEVARWLRKVFEAPVVFVTGCLDRATVECIHQQVPGAPVLPKPVWSDRLADAVKAVMAFRMW
jgi:two-component system, response regulator PdtaR